MEKTKHFSDTRSINTQETKVEKREKKIEISEITLF